MAIELTTATESELGALQEYTNEVNFYQSAFPNQKGVQFRINSPSILIPGVGYDLGTFVNFGALANFSMINIDKYGLNGGTGGLLDFSNADKLTKLEDIGTSQAVYLRNNQLTDTKLNEFFTALPSTTKTVTINVGANPGSATCDPSIATAKGYIVVT